MEPLELFLNSNIEIDKTFTTAKTLTASYIDGRCLIAPGDDGILRVRFTVNSSKYFANSYKVDHEKVVFQMSEMRECCRKPIGECIIYTSKQAYAGTESQIQ